MKKEQRIGNGAKPSSHTVLLLSFIAIGVVLSSSALESYAVPDFQASPTPTATPNRVAIFQDVTDMAGVAFTGAQFGASWGDYDNDGWADLFANNHFQNRPNVYHNNADGTFTDVYTSTGILSPADAERDPPVRDPHGSSWGDYDNDDDLDLYINTGRLRINPFYVNLGDGTFVERAIQAGIADLSGRGRTANWVDYDRDGDLDLFKGNEVRTDGPDKLYRNNNNGTFTDVSNRAGLNNTSSTWGNVWGDYDNDGDMDVVLTGGSSVKLYRNNGDGTFTETTAAAGLIEHDIRSWGADLGDYDNDGDLDLYVARANYSTFDHLNVTRSTITYFLENEGDVDGFDFRSSSEVTFDTLGEGGLPMPRSQVYIGANRRHPGTIPFTLGAGSDHYGAPSFAPGFDTGVFIWQSGPGGAWHFRASNMIIGQGRLRTNGTLSNISNFDLEPYNPSAKPNRLYRNCGNGTFEEVGATAGVNSVRRSRTGTWGDYNNDGLLDLYVINSGNVAIGNEANHLYRNSGDGTFTDVAAEAGVQAVTPGLGDCAAWADYDHNGFLDLFVVTDGTAGYLSGPHKLYRNLGNGNHWLEIKLVGVVSNRQGIGARVVLTSGDSQQIRQMNNGSHYLCQNSPILHFGLAGAAHAQAITVTWPSGIQQVLRDVPADQILTVVEGQYLTITKSAGSEIIRPGDCLTYTLTVANLPTAVSPAANLVVTDVLPFHTTFIDAGFIPPACGVVYTTHVGAAGAVCWKTFDPLAVNDQASFYVTVQTHRPLSNGTIITNVYGMTCDTLLQPVWRTLTTTITSGPAITLTKQVFPEQVAPGSIVTYTITVTNSGNETAEGVLISDTLPVGFAPRCSSWRRTISGTDVLGTPGVISLVFTATAPGIEGEYINIAQAILGVDTLSSNTTILQVRASPCITFTTFMPIILK